jgi:hypothetical protein
MAHAVKIGSLTDELISLITGISVEVSICLTLLLNLFLKSNACLNATLAGVLNY